MAPVFKLLGIKCCGALLLQAGCANGRWLTRSAGETSGRRFLAAMAPAAYVKALRLCMLGCCTLLLVTPRRTESLRLPKNLNRVRASSLFKVLAKGRWEGGSLWSSGWLGWMRGLSCITSRSLSSLSLLDPFSGNDRQGSNSGKRIGCALRWRLGMVSGRLRDPCGICSMGVERLRLR